MHKAPISLVVITLNEEKNIERCLRAADFCEEVVIVDSGSKDRTLEICRSFGAKVSHRTWTGYRDQKNYGTEQAAQPWVLCIDADEVVSLELRNAILAAFRQDPACDGFEINRHGLYAGKLINHGGWNLQWRIFLYRKGKALWGGEEPHTTVHFTGQRTSRLPGDLYHYTYDSIGQHISKNAGAARDWAMAMQRIGKRATWFDLVFRSSWAFLRTYVFQLGFLDGFYGLVIATVAGWYTFTKYAMLRELTLQRRDAGPL